MIRKLLLSAVAVAGMATGLMAQSTNGHPAQPCATDRNTRILQAQHPEMAAIEAELERQIQNGLGQLDVSKLAKTTAESDNLHLPVYDIPVVVHIVHDYGAEYLTDNVVFGMVDNWTRFFLRQNADTNNIQPFDGFIPPRQYTFPMPDSPQQQYTRLWYKGKANFRFHLATKDPQGNPTKGITRSRSWLTSTGSDQTKLEQWNPTNYVNIWIVRDFDENHLSAAAYATPPSSGAVDPFSDGVIGRSDQSVNDLPTIPHELGHIFSLAHTWGNTNEPEVACGDDAVDDTPPTEGHLHCYANGLYLYDTNCLRNIDTLGRRINGAFLPVADSLTYLGIDFKAISNLTINNVTIYPASAVGTPFTITLRKYGFVVDSYSGVTTTDSSAQVVPVAFAVAADSGYQMVLTVNPGALRDSTQDTSYIKTVANVIKIGNDHTGGKYNYFYNWNITAGASSYSVGRLAPVREFSTTSNNNAYSISFSTRSRVIIRSVTVYPTGRVGAPFKLILRNAAGTQVASATDTIVNRYKAQKVNLGWVINTPVTPYRILFAQNPGMLREADDFDAYTHTVKGAISILGDSTGGRYNYFHDIAIFYGYFKFYGTGENEYMIDYPDTTHTENIMDYSFCTNRVFTNGQVDRMRSAITSSTAGRNNLWKIQNLITTGVKLDSVTFAPRPELKPIADFAVNPANSNSGRRFFCANGTATAFTFKNESYNDTIVSALWTLPADATTTTSTSTVQVSTGFTTPGWKSVSLTVTGNHDGGEDWTSTVTKDSIVYAADPNAVSGVGYFQEFNPGSDVDMFPMINYYDADHRWELHNRGYYDNTGVSFRNYDDRDFPQSNINTPRGLYSDLFTRAFDLSDPTFASNCNLNFMSAGAWRTNVSAEMNDSLIVEYSTTCGTSWVTMAKIGGAALGNNGFYNGSYDPNWNGEWKAQAINIPTAARKPQVFFRFRYRPGVSEETVVLQAGEPAVPTFRFYSGTGNNFYMDRLSISSSALGVVENMADMQGVVVAPNPTTGSTTVTIKGSNGAAQIHVMDVAGKLVYSTAATLNGHTAQVEIPASAITVKGIYLVQVISGGHTETRKLVVY